VDLEEGAVPWQGVQTEDTGGTQEGIAIPGYKSITVDAGKANVKVNFQNPEGNPCYFRISLRLDDGTVLHAVQAPAGRRVRRDGEVRNVQPCRPQPDERRGRPHHAYSAVMQHNARFAAADKAPPPTRQIERMGRKT